MPSNFKLLNFRKYGNLGYQWEIDYQVNILEFRTDENGFGLFCNSVYETFLQIDTKENFQLVDNFKKARKKVYNTFYKMLNQDE